MDLRSVTQQINKLRGRFWPALLFFLIFISSIIYLPTKLVSLRVGREVIMEWGIFALIIGFLWREGLNKWLVAFLGWSLITMVMRYNIWSAQTFNTILFYVILYFIMTQIINSKRRVGIVLNMICLVALVQAGWCILQFFNLDPVFNARGGTGDIVVGFLDNRNLLVAGLAFCVPAFLRKQWVYLLPVVLLPFCQSHTRGGLIALAIGLVFWAIFSGVGRTVKFWALGALALVMVASCVFWWVGGLTGAVKSGYLGRWEFSKRIAFVGSHMHLNKIAVDPATNKPLILGTVNNEVSYKGVILGHGLGSFKVLFPAVQKVAVEKGIWSGVWPKDAMFRQAHNDPLQAGFEQGLIVLIFVIGFVVWMFRRFYRLKDEPEIVLAGSAFVMIIVNSLVNFPWHVAGLAWIMLGWIAILEGRWVCQSGKIGSIS